MSTEVTVGSTGMAMAPMARRARRLVMFEKRIVNEELRSLVNWRVFDARC